ncbi:hypothetical protein B0T22DRAFT_445713 [Podospora appendiculata]|uniref:Uncharacterized protein n=1 Tax=Podospora appendiculata TaxID=314037 RepID=A0AAE0WZ22_9PEZI|nr:hypothetical protein B0T22DRAFT_445713 [Podospora appendiculata]
MDSGSAHMQPGLQSESQGGDDHSDDEPLSELDEQSISFPLYQPKIKFFLPSDVFDDTAEDEPEDVDVLLSDPEDSPDKDFAISALGRPRTLLINYDADDEATDRDWSELPYDDSDLDSDGGPDSGRDDDGGDKASDRYEHDEKPEDQPEDQPEDKPEPDKDSKDNSKDPPPGDNSKRRKRPVHSKYPCPDWVISLDCDVHIARDRAWFGNDYRPYKTTVVPLPPSNSPPLQAIGIGTVILSLQRAPSASNPDRRTHGTLTLQTVLHVPSAPYNIIGSPVAHTHLFEALHLPHIARYGGLQLVPRGLLCAISHNHTYANYDYRAPFVKARLSDVESNRALALAAIRDALPPVPPRGGTGINGLGGVGGGWKVVGTITQRDNETTTGYFHNITPGCRFVVVLGEEGEKPPGPAILGQSVLRHLPEGPFARRPKGGRL